MKKKISSFFLFISIFFFFPGARAEEQGFFWGQVVNQDQKPLNGVKITLSSQTLSLTLSSACDKSGFFLFPGVSQGRYVISFEWKGRKCLLEKEIFFDLSQSLFLRIFLFQMKDSDNLVIQASELAPSSCLSQTLVRESQIEDFPTGLNVWSLVENHDLSATTNRIDVGGMWGSFPALFSSRGGCSWTQNIYLVNSIEVSDTYWTGMPLLYPDFSSLRSTQLINAGHPSLAFHPGGYFNLETKEETPDYRGGISIFYSDKNLKSNNVTPALQKEGIRESHSLNLFRNINFHLSGPLSAKKLHFFTSATTSSYGRDIANFEKEDQASILSALVSFKYFLPRGSLRLLWTGQTTSHPTYGAGRKIPFSATLDQKNHFNVFQLLLNSSLGKNHFLKAGLSFSLGNIHSRFQEGIREQSRFEIAGETFGGAAPYSSRDNRGRLTFLLDGNSLIPSSIAILRSRYGIQFQHVFSSSKKQVLDNVHCRFFNQEPQEVVLFSSPFHHQEAALHLNLYAEQTLTFPNLLSLYGGLNLGMSWGWTPGQKNNRISWLNLSPRLGIILPLGKAKKSFLKLSLARYFYTLPLNYLTYGNPEAWGGLVHAWKDKNGDGQYQKGEEGNLIRRIGPFFSSIDPELKRPFTDELSLSFSRVFGNSLFFSLSGFLRRTKNLVETSNPGVPFSSYDPLSFFDIGDDRIPNTHDDFTFTIFNRKNEYLGKDFFLLTNPDSGERTSHYEGLDLVLIKNYFSRITFFLSLTATQATGTTNPGNTEWENDDGVVGSLYDDPNTLINARGRMRFDRAYTGRIGFLLFLPWQTNFSCLVKYYDGQPFTRKILISGFNQGPFYIQAFPRGVARYEFNLTVDARIEKAFLLGKGKLRFFLDGFNIFNSSLATEENEWTGPLFPLRFATEIQSPRFFRLGLSYEF